MTDYEVTEAAICVRLSPTERRKFLRGFVLRAGDARCDAVLRALGEPELKRLVTQGYLKVVGLREGLERGTSLPNPDALPSEVVTDASGNNILSKKQATTPQLHLPPPPAGAPTEAAVREPSAAELLAHGLSPSRPEPKIGIVAPGMPAALPDPGVPAGRWDLDPERVKDMPLDAINALILDRDPTAPTFGEGEEADARAFITSDYGTAAASAAARQRPYAAGEASTESDPNVHAVRMT